MREQYKGETDYDIFNIVFGNRSEIDPWAPSMVNNSCCEERLVSYPLGETPVLCSMSGQKKKKLKPHDGILSAKKIKQ